MICDMITQKNGWAGRSAFSFVARFHLGGNLVSRLAISNKPRRSD